jgi:hypothetical protein
MGDIDCDGDVDPVDGLKMLRHDAQLDVQQTQPCPEDGEMVLVNGVLRPWGDIDCDNDVDPGDGLKALRHDAQLDVAQNEPCPDPGTPVTVVHEGH